MRGCRYQDFPSWVQVSLVNEFLRYDMILIIMMEFDEGHGIEFCLHTDMSFGIRKHYAGKVSMPW